MNLTTDQEQLDLLDEKRSALLDAMTKVSTRLIAQVAQELPERWEEIVRRFIRGMPEVAMAQGSDGLSRLKKELHRLQTRACSIAAKHLSGPNVWRHQAITEQAGGGHQAGSVPSSRFDPNRRSRISGPISRAESEVLYLLRPVFGSRSGPWLDSAQGKLSPELEQMFDAYEQLSLQLEDVELERAELGRRIAGERAQQLWENA